MEKISTYDGVIIGAGHNSLVLQAYAGAAGLKTICLERRLTAGGGLATMEDPRHPGVYHNTHSFFHRGITSMPWYKDLGLERLGASYIEPELNVAMILADGRSLQWWSDIERTVNSVAQFSYKDAKTVQRWHDSFLPIVESILEPDAQSPPMQAEHRKAMLNQSPEGRLLMETSELSPLEFVTREFESPVVQAGMLFFNGLREVDLRARGFGHHIPSLLASSARAQMCVGGSAALARALVSASSMSGGAIRLGIEPREILVEDGRAVGVRTSSGETLMARSFVASGLNPRQTFVELLDERSVPSSVRALAGRFVFNTIAPVFALNLYLDEAPVYSAELSHPEVGEALMTIIGLESIDQYHEIVTHHEMRTMPPTVMWGACPSKFDPVQAPTGKHTAFMWEKVPYSLRGDARNWDSESRSQAYRMLAKWCRYAPNLESAVLDMIWRSPLDIESSLANMQGGDLLVGAFTNDQVGINRPFSGAGRYRCGAPRGLYLCGSSSHPGGNITGLPGYNCAQVLLDDLGVKWPGAEPPGVGWPGSYS